MMSWPTEIEIRRQVERLWKHGEILRAVLGKSAAFPFRLRLRMPSTRETAMELNRAQQWDNMLRQVRGLRIAYQSVRTQTLGLRNFPQSLWVDCADDAVALLAMEQQTKQFLDLHRETADEHPELLLWLERNPLKVLSLYPSWPNLLQLVGWVKLRPAEQQLYIRQVDIAGIDTKFFEEHISVLADLFDIVLGLVGEGRPRGRRALHDRYGLLLKPRRVRFRILDPAIQFAGLAGLPDVELDEDSFASLRLPINRVFMTENKTNFLSFLPVCSSIVVFGAGYGMKAIGRAKWIRELPLYYWGDIDTHGFAILAELRRLFPQAQSLLMDRETLFRNAASWSTECAPIRHDVQTLSSEEMAVFDLLRSGVPRPGIRLEQEKIPLSWLQKALESCLAGFPWNKTSSLRFRSD